MSIARAVALVWRRMSHIETILRPPNVFCRLYLSSAKACSTRTIDQSASNSSGDDHGQRDPHALAHLRTRDRDRHTIVVLDAQKTPGLNKAVAGSGVGSAA